MKRLMLLCSCLLIGGLTSSAGLSRGGETGTLEIFELDAFGAPMTLDGRRPRYHISHETFRRLLSRLSHRPSAPIPGWMGQQAIRYKNMILTQDKLFEVAPWDDSYKGLDDFCSDR